MHTYSLWQLKRGKYHVKAVTGKAHPRWAEEAALTYIAKAAELAEAREREVRERQEREREAREREAREREAREREAREREAAAATAAAATTAAAAAALQPQLQPQPQPQPAMHAQAAVQPQIASPPGSVRQLRKQIRGLRAAQAIPGQEPAALAARAQEIDGLECDVEERERKFRKYGQW